MIQLLRKIKLFEDLTEEELRRIEAICQQERLAKDTVVFKEGEEGDKCYLITEGAVRISKFIPGVGEEALAVLKAGDYFGEMALIDNFPRSAYAIANADTTCLTISKAALDRLLAEDKEIAYKLLWTFCRTLSARLRETNEKISAFFAMMRF